MDLVPNATPFSHRDMIGSIFRFVTPAVWNKLLRRSFLLDERLRFEPGLRRAEDVAFTYTALLKAKRITVIDKALVNYRAELPTGLQATIHEEPLEICHALLVAKETALAAGSFEEIELDFINAALYLCLFTLRSLRTIVAYKELYEALKSRYFVELGINGVPSERFLNPNDYEHFQSIMAVSADAYLLAEARSLRGLLTECAAESRSLRARLTNSLNEGNSMRDELRTTDDRLSKTTAKLAATTTALERILNSRSYRVTRGFNSSMRRIVRFFSRSRKAE
jgi:hypothetical protein